MFLAICGAASMQYKVRTESALVGVNLMNKRSLPFVWVCVLSAVVFSVLSARAMLAESPRPVQLKVLRMHSGKDCTSGQISMEGTIVGYTLERPWQGNIPLISSIPPGRYQGFVRTKTEDRWRIELVNVPNRGNIQLHIGNFVADSVGCILIGSNLTASLCQLSDSKAAFEKFKLAFADAAAKLGQKDVDTPIELSIEDQ